MAKSLYIRAKKEGHIGKVILFRRFSLRYEEGPKLILGRGCRAVVVMILARLLPRTDVTQSHLTMVT